MKRHILAAGLVVLASAAAVPAMAGTKDYIAICGNMRLTATERTACRAEMRAATTDAERTQLFRTYDLRTIGFDANGQRFSAKPIQEAEAVTK